MRLLLYISLPLLLLSACSANNNLDAYGSIATLYFDGSEYYVYEKPNEPELMYNHEPASDTYITPGPGFYDDAVFMVEALEEAHVVFLFGDRLPDNYMEQRDIFLSESRYIDTSVQFTRAIMRYLAALGCEYTSLGFVEGDAFRFLDVTWSLDGDRLFLQETSDQPPREVTSIGGVFVYEVLDFAGRHFFANNEVTRNLFLPVFAREMEILSLVGVVIENGLVTISLCNGGLEQETTDIQAGFLLQRFFQAASVPTAQGVSHEMIGNVLYVRMRQFAFGRSLDEALVAIRNAIYNGTTKFILDLRGNPGGTSEVYYRVLDAMGFPPFTHGRVMRVSELWLNRTVRAVPNFEEIRDTIEWYNPETIARGYMAFPLPTNVDNPKDVFISVLTDNFTGSMAAVFSALVQDLGIGIVIGEPSFQSPSVFVGPHSITESRWMWQLPDVWVSEGNERYESRIYNG